MLAVANRRAPRHDKVTIPIMMKVGRLRKNAKRKEEMKRKRAGEM